MRISLCFVLAACLLAGCASTSASTPTPTPKPRATPTPTGMRFSHAPHMQINVHHNFTATLTTTDGSFSITLFPKLAPLTVNNFVFLARHHFYDGNIFVRIIRQFMIQTGDPTGTGMGGPGYVFKDEIHPKIPYVPGVVAMANHGPNTNGSQFFIVTGPQGLALPPQFTIFGRVSSGAATVRKIASTPVGVNPGMNGELSLPLQEVTIKRVVIHETP